MVIVSVCVGSSCHIKGSPDIVEMMKSEIEKNRLDEEIILIGSFCTGKCNRSGVTVTVGDDVYTGVTKETFKEFWTNKVLSKIEA